MAGKKFTTAANDTRVKLVGLDDPLPSNYFWFEGDGYSIYAAEQPQSTWREHTHDCAQIAVGLEARVRMEWRTGAKPPDRRDAIGNVVSVIPPGEPHRTLWHRRATLVFIFLTRDFLASTARRTSQQTCIDLQPAHLMRDPLIEDLARALYHECEAHDLSRFYADSMTTVLATYLLRNYNASPEVCDSFSGLGPARTRRVREYIEKSLEHDLSIDALAKVAGLSPTYFADLFRQTTGFTPHQYVCSRRADRARELLTHPDLPIAEVAHRCGFTSQSQFTTVFNRLTGVTPGRFRAEHARHDNPLSATT